MTRYLIVGSSGFVGCELYHGLAAMGHSVIGTYHRNAFPGLRRLDLRDESAVKEICDGDFDLILHAGGLIHVGACEVNRDDAVASNVQGTHHLINAARTKVLYLSTDYVFDGLKGSYDEDDTPNPINFYGWTKRKAEKIVLSHPQNLIIRLPFVYGRSRWGEHFLGRFRLSEVLAPRQMLCNPLYLPDLIQHLEALAKMDGIIHLGGPTMLSRYDFYSLVCRKLRLETKVSPATMDQTFGNERRPLSAILRSRRHRLPLHTVDEGLTLMRSLLVGGS